METLKKILTGLNITTKEALAAHVAELRSGRVLSPTLTIRGSQSLQLDSEDRIHGDEIVYDRTVFDVPVLKIQNSQRIVLKDCVFMGALHISQKNPQSVTEILCDSCVLLGDLRIAQLPGGGKVTLHETNASVIALSNCDLQKLSISSSIIPLLTITGCKVHSFTTFQNRVGDLDVSANEFGACSFDHQQVRIDKLTAVSSAKARRRNYTSFCPVEFVDGVDLDGLRLMEGKTSRAGTFEFLLKHSTAQLDREKYAHIRYLQTVATQPNCLMRAVMRAFGAFVKPYRILLAMVAAMGMFSLVYGVLPLKFIAPSTLTPGKTEVRTLTLREGVYYAGVTFITVSYGDIIPLGASRVACVAEGLLGITLASSLVVSLTRKYVE